AEITGSKVAIGTGTGRYSETVTGLTPGIQYFVKAFATNRTGISYGKELSFISLSAGTIPVTDFYASSTTVSVSQNIQFTDLSTGFPSGWSWDFGDGSSSDQRNPLYNYAEAGTYTVSLTTANKYGFNTEVKTDYITVNLNSNNTNDILFNPGLTYGSVTDIDGNIYKTIQIGTQTWMAENLRTTRYNNGTEIPLVTNSSTWASLSTPAYCWYNNDKFTYGNTYGALYNFFTIDTNILCPTGWHVPANIEWDTLIGYLGGRSIAGSKLKETGIIHWVPPINEGVTNESGFTALPGGYRDDNGPFLNMGGSGYWWSLSWYHYMYNNNSYVDRWFADNRYGFSVRCVKDQ
ncbi:MAG: PKD domain-containing protein, partial [Bacteroidales bacterium]|nr:PKD domain-containing protein [Bacteroidales bacterium]